MFFRSVFLCIATILYAKPLYTLRIEHISKDIGCVIGDFGPPTKRNHGFISNSCYIALKDGVVVIDPGPTYEFAKEFANLIKKQTKKPITAVVVTNYHDDRLYGASYYAAKHIPVIAHKSIVQEIKENPKKFECLPKVLSKKDFEKTKLVIPNVLFDKKYVIDNNIYLLKLTPASQERSDIVVWYPKEKFLFAGNIVFNERALSYTKNSDINGWIEALKKIGSLHPKIIVGGHGKVKGPNGYQRTLSYLETLKKEVEKVYDAGVDMSELPKHIDLEKFDCLLHSKTLNLHNANTYYMQLEWQE